MALDRGVGDKFAGNRIWQGLLIGGLGGAALGGLLGSDCVSGDWLCVSRGEAAAAFGALGGGLGLVFGIVGAATKTTIWQPVKVGSETGTLAWAPTVTTAAVGFRVTIRF